MNHAQAQSLLRDPAKARVCRMPDKGLDVLLAAAASCGFAVRRANLGQAIDRNALLGVFASAFAFPQWFGHNWDALADCLGDLSWLPAQGYLLLIEGTAAFRFRHEADLATALDILASASDAWREVGVPFWVLIDDKLDRVPIFPA